MVFLQKHRKNSRLVQLDFTLKLRQQYRKKIDHATDLSSLPYSDARKGRCHWLAQMLTN